MEVLRTVLNEIVVLLVIIGSVLLEMRQAYFHADDRFKDVLVQSGIVFKTSFPKVFFCFIKCIQTGECVSVFYHPANYACLGFNSKLHYSSIITVLPGMLYFENTGLYGNLAAGKPTMASSVFDNKFVSSFATDWNRNNLQDKGFCYHSEFRPAGIDPNPWIYVDLGKNYAIISVSILAREECCPERMASMAITVGERTDSFNQTCIADTGRGFINSMETFTCQTGVIGQYVKVQVFDSILNICELEVYGF